MLFVEFLELGYFLLLLFVQAELLLVLSEFLLGSFEFLFVVGEEGF